MGERGQPGDFAVEEWGMQGREVGRERSLVPRDPGKGFILGELCRLRDQGLEQHRPLLLLPRKNCPESGLSLVCPGHKPAAGLSQD